MVRMLTPILNYPFPLQPRTSVTYGGGLFVAVAASGAGNRVQTSRDGINWTSQKSAADNDWRDVTWGNGTFVAVAASGTGNRVMTSPDEPKERGRQCVG